MRVLRFIGIFGFASMLAVVPAAQDQPEQAAKPFTSEVNYVRVDMYPTRDGKPITDLQQSEIELFEDGQPQAIQQFEHVYITGPRLQTTRREVSTVDEMRRATQDPRARVVVIFLDPRFVDVLGSMKARKPLVDALDRLIGGDDLIAVMTPAMSPRQLTFSRRTTSVSAMLEEYWGLKGWPGIRDKTEFLYEACYDTPTKDDSGTYISRSMIARRREMQTLDALDALTSYLRDLREERKAVITVTDGWPLYGPEPGLRKPLVDPGGQQREIPIPKIGTVPGTGRVGVTDPSSRMMTNDGAEQIDRTRCETDRLMLSELNHQQRFIRMMQAANRANVSFYPVDPQRLFSEGATLRRNWALETMAQVTDGMMIDQIDAFESGLQRIVDDLSSYYLIGYYTTAKPDGRFHRIDVRVKRPGVNVRARAGYLAPTPEEARRPVISTSSADHAEAAMLSRALGALVPLTRSRTIRLQTAAGWKPSGTAGVWIVAEITPDADDSAAWTSGATLEVTLTDPAGTTLAAPQVPVTRTAAGISVKLPLTPKWALDEGDYQVQVRGRAPGALTPPPETVRFSLAGSPMASGALFFRRGISTGNREVPTADPRFRRTERLVLEIPTPSQTPAAARVLGRTGTALTVPVTVAVRDDADGSRWHRIELTLAPLAPGDYLIETTAGERRTLTAFRLIP